MKDTLEDIMKDAKSVFLKKDEYVRMRADLVSFMKLHPVRIPLGFRHIMKKWSDQFYFINLIPNIRIMPIALLITLLLSGGVSYAAEGAMPGDVLYPIKINVNEEVRGLLTIQEDAKANWEARRAERRLEEAEELAVRGELRDEVRTRIAENFENHAERVHQIASRLRDNNNPNAADIASRFETSLRVHAQILERLDEKRQGHEGGTEAEDNLRTKVRERRNSILEIRNDVERRITEHAEDIPNGKFAAERKKKAAEDKINEVKRLFEAKKGDLNKNTVSEVESKIKTAEELFLQGKAKFDEGAYGEAFVAFQRAIAAAQEAKILVETPYRLNLDGFQIQPITGFADDDRMSVDSRGGNQNTDGDGSATSRGEVRTNEESGGGTEFDLRPR